VFMGDSPVHLEGRHFTFDGRATNARLDAVDCGFPCDERETVSLYAIVNGNDLPGFATFRGVDYPDVGSMTGPNQMQLVIKGRIKLPRIRDMATATNTALVRVRGFFVHEQIPLAEPVAETFVGDAIATVTVGLYEENYEQWTIRHLAYDIVRRR
jgi:hypothetical protein